MTTRRLSVRELRARLKQHMEGNEAVSIGNYYDLRAVLVPVPRHDRWNKRERAKALKKALRLFKAAIAADN